MSMVSEFRTFIQRGNVIDLAVGIIIGSAFTKIVASLVGDVLTPLLGLLIGGINFSALKLTIAGTPEHPVTINVGNFLQAVVDFFIVAFCVFLLVKAVNTMKRPKEEPVKAPELNTTEKLLTEIRDLLHERR